MKRLATALLLTTFVLPAQAGAALLSGGKTTPAAAAADKDRREWVQLFDGKSLDGWIPKISGYETGVNFGDTFRVESGVIRVSYDKYDGRFANRFGHMFYKQPFSHYIVRVEYRFVGDQVPDGPAWAFRNSGIMIHGQPPETMKKDQDFPICIEVQLLGGTGKDGQPRTTGNLCTPGTNVVMKGKLVTDHCVNSSSPRLDGDQWVTAEVEVHGAGRVVQRINGQDVLEYEQPQVGGGNVTNFDPAVKQDGKLLEEGSISLQSESHPVEFRKVEILNLVGCMDPKAVNYKTYFEKDDRASCRYK